MPNFDVDELFTYHPPTEQQVGQMQLIRRKAKDLAQTILENSPPSADQSTAIRKLRECVMTANAAIVLEGR